MFASAAVMAAASMYSSAYSADKAQEASREQMAFQADQSGTAYQRAVKDMRAAGINPIMAHARGGASTPSGAMPSQFFDADKGISSALSAARLGAEIQNIRADTILKDRQEMLARYQGSKVLEERDLVQQERMLLEKQQPGATIEARLDRPGGQGEWTRAIQRWLPFFNSAGSAARGSGRR